MQIFIAKDIDELSQQLADWIIEYIETILKKQDRFTWVLSGGNTPKKLYQLLSSEKYKNKIEWNKLHFFWGDERYVPFEDERNNAKMCFENLLDKVSIIKEQVHVMRTDIEPEQSAIEYEKILHAYFPNEDQSFDLVMLGMGNDGHVLSLFPGYDTVHEKKYWVRYIYLKEQTMYRITLTAPIVNAAGRVVFITSGTDKAAALSHVLSHDYDPDLYPSQAIQPNNGELYWWIDEAAATGLK